VPERQDRASESHPTPSDGRIVFGEWLAGFRWTAWGTFTFRPGCPRYCPLEHEHKRGWGGDGPSPQRAFHHFGRFIDTLKGPRVGVFYCVERGGIGGRSHCHALLRIDAGPMEVTRKGVDHAWGDRYGRCQIRAYDSELGAVHYLTKYLTKEPLLWDVGALIVGE